MILPQFELAKVECATLALIVIGVGVRAIKFSLKFFRLMILSSLIRSLVILSFLIGYWLCYLLGVIFDVRSSKRLHFVSHSAYPLRTILKPQISGRGCSEEGYV